MKLINIIITGGVEFSLKCIKTRLAIGLKRSASPSSRNGRHFTPMGKGRVMEGKGSERVRKEGNERR